MRLIGAIQDSRLLDGAALDELASHCSPTSR